MDSFTATPKTLIRLFKAYPYKRFQTSISHMDVEVLTQIQLEAFTAHHMKIILSHDPGKTWGLASFVPFTQMSRLFSLRSFILKDYLIDPNMESPLYHYKKLLKSFMAEYEKQLDFIITRQPINNVYGIRSLIQKGFYYVCGEAVFSFSVKDMNVEPSSVHLPKSISITEANDKDLEQVYAIANKSHQENRYLYDDFFSKEQVKALYCKCIETSYRDETQKLLVCRRKDEVMGFITLVYNRVLSEKMTYGYGSLDYIAVKHGTERQGIGYALNLYGMEVLRSMGVDYIMVKTMANNYKAMALLMKTGFVMSSQNVILHWRSSLVK